MVGWWRVGWRVGSRVGLHVGLGVAPRIGLVVGPKAEIVVRQLDREDAVAGAPALREAQRGVGLRPLQPAGVSNHLGRFARCGTSRGFGSGRGLGFGSSVGQASTGIHPMRALTSRSASAMVWPLLGSTRHS